MLGCLCWAWWTWYRSAFTPSRSASIEDMGRGNVVLRGVVLQRALSTLSTASLVGSVDSTVSLLHQPPLQYRWVYMCTHLRRTTGQNSVNTPSNRGKPPRLLHPPFYSDDQYDRVRLAREALVSNDELDSCPRGPLSPRPLLR